MNRILIILFLLFFLASPSLVMAVDHDPIERSGSEKGVGASTDVILLALPVATLTGVLIERDWDGLKQGALSIGTSLAATLILKQCIKEWRPDFSNRHSFPSGHTSTTFSTATFLQCRYGWKVGVPAYVLATYVGWGRVYAKKHHWWDVLAGAAIGAGSALIYTHPFAGKHDLQIIPEATPSGASVTACITF